jgi:hypothetical protein
MYLPPRRRPVRDDDDERRGRETTRERARARQGDNDDQARARGRERRRARPVCRAPRRAILDCVSVVIFACRGVRGRCWFRVRLIAVGGVARTP